MHAIKGGWVGQTFALATCSDSGGKKARIRRSKEERKAMVESFIKRYQNSNNGSFPSLNLTHKEVGGSFYIVREIVREVIQENRVLGPAKLSTVEQNDYAFLEEYPLGSISTEPQTHVFSSEETRVTTILHQSTSEDHVLNSNGKFCEPEHQSIKDDQVVDSNSVALGKDQESDESSITLSMPIDDENTGEQQFLSSSERVPAPVSEQFVNEETITDLEAILQEEESDEPIPTDTLTIHHEETSIEQLQSCSKELPGSGVSMFSSEDFANGSSKQSSRYEESSEEVLVESLEQESLGIKKDGAKEQEVLEAGMTQMIADVVVETFPLRPVSKIAHDLDERSSESGEITNPLEEKKTEDDRLNSPENGSVSSNEKGQAIQEVLEVEKNKEMMDGKAVLATPLENPNESTMKESVMPEHSGTSDLDKASSPVETKPVIAPNGIHRENLNTTGTGGSPKQSIFVETTSNQNRLTVQHGSSSKKGSSPTLNRINLETWEGRLRKSARPETNPLLGLFKAFITAFVKFWTE